MATIKEDYVSFEIAKLLKEKGFDEGCSFVVNAISKGVMPVSWPTTNSDIEDERASLIALPTLQMAMKWLREVHNLFIEIRIGNSKDEFWYDYNIIPINEKEIDWKNYKEVPYIECYSYEEACEAAIKYCLENLI